jgi:molecular chaperone GrpE
MTEVAALQEQVESLQQEAQNNLDGWQRERAEFTNYKRRTTQELADSRQKGALEAISKFLPVIDDFERAVENVPEDLTENPWVNGTALILKNIEKILDQYNVEAIDPVGEEFDPNQHEAVIMENSDEYESGIVTATLQKGYRSGERVLRPALVRVAS